MKKAELFNCLQDIEFCVADLEVETLVLNLFETCPHLDRYDPSLVDLARSRSIGFVKDHVAALAVSYQALEALLNLPAWPDAVEIGKDAG